MLLIFALGRCRFLPTSLSYPENCDTRYTVEGSPPPVHALQSAHLQDCDIIVCRRLGWQVSLVSRYNGVLFDLIMPQDCGFPSPRTAGSILIEHPEVAPCGYTCDMDKQLVELRPE